MKKEKFRFAVYVFLKYKKLYPDFIKWLAKNNYGDRKKTRHLMLMFIRSAGHYEELKGYPCYDRKAVGSDYYFGKPNLMFSTAQEKWL